jgi:uncharacterized protein YdiU (UPF0061 family)
VMNTDNTALSGETIDFGPCAFMDSYDPATAFSAIDEFGRYAYANQPTIARWNLAKFAETLLPLVDPNPERAVELASEAISAFMPRYQEHWLAGMRDKLGISSNEDGDLDLVGELLQAMHENAADFTLTFRRLCAAAADETADAEARVLFANPGPTTVGPSGGDRVWSPTGGNPTRAPRRCEPSIQRSSRAIITWSKRSTQRSTMETFRRSPTC